MVHCRQWRVWRVRRRGDGRRYAATDRARRSARGRPPGRNLREDLPRSLLPRGVAAEAVGRRGRPFLAWSLVSLFWSSAWSLGPALENRGRTLLPGLKVRNGRLQPFLGSASHVSITSEG